MNGTRVGTDFKLGSTVTYQCDSGYRIVEPSSITCVIGTDGKPSWDHVLPSCRGESYPTVWHSSLGGLHALAQQEGKCGSWAAVTAGVQLLRNLGQLWDLLMVSGWTLLPFIKVFDTFHFCFMY